MYTKRNYSTAIISIAVVMIMALAYFAYYRCQMNDAFKIKRRLPVTKVEYEDDELVLLDAANLPANVTVDQSLVLVNGDNPLPELFEADVVYYHDTDVLMNGALIDSYAELSAAVSDRFDEKLYVESCYRTREHQQEIYEESGPEIAAVPGTSEHETGLALDVYVMYYAGAGFIDSKPGRFVNDNCEDYGFIIRYPRGEEEITGFEFEPWHIRYVGFPHSDLIESCNLTLEEYVDRYKPGAWYRCDADDVSSIVVESASAAAGIPIDFWMIARVPEDELKIPSEYLDCPMTISPDNMGNVFITIAVNE